MRSEAALGEALKQIRTITGVTQEDFGLVSSRTYVSTVERGLKSPTLGKIEQLAGVLGVHPLVLLTAAYMDRFTHKEVERIAARLRNELLEIVDGE